MMISSACSRLIILAKILATCNGCKSKSVSVLMKMARSTPIASAVLRVSTVLSVPILTAIVSLALPLSLRVNASSTAISQKGFIAIFALVKSTSCVCLFIRA